MVKVRITASSDDVKQAEEGGIGDFKLPPVGVYVLTMGECNAGFSKGDDGEPDKKKPRLECIYTITGIGPEEAPVNENYGKLWDYVSFSEASGWKRAEFMKAFGFQANASGEYNVEVDTDDFINRKVIARIKHEDGRTKDDGKRAKIAKLVKYGTDLNSGGLEDTAPDYGNDSPNGDADPFGSEPEPTFYTVDDLEALSLKELGALFKDAFDGDPTQHIVKGKDKKTDPEATKEAVVNAILEAQGDPAEDGEDPDDENPF